MLISIPTFGAERTPKLCSAELAFVTSQTVGSKPSTLDALHGKPTRSSGIKDLLVIGNVLDAQENLIDDRLPQTHRQQLNELTDGHFATGHVYTLSGLGVSAWNSLAELDEWKAMRDEFLNTRRASVPEDRYRAVPSRGFAKPRRPVVNTLLEILATHGGVTGVRDELLLDLRHSYLAAVGAANVVSDAKLLREERFRRKTIDLQPSRRDAAFDYLYEDYLRHDRIRQGTRPIKLPFTLIGDGELNLDDASALHILEMLVRYPVVARLQSGFGEDQLITGALFPELVPMLASAPQPLGDKNMVRWIDPDDRLTKIYRMSVGTANPYVFGEAFTSVIGADLTRLGLEQSFGVKLVFQRREVGDSEPGPLEAFLQIEMRRSRYPEEKLILADGERQSIERALTRVLTQFRAFRDLPGVTLRGETRPGERDFFRLEIPNADLETYVHAFEIFSEFNRFENRL